MFFNGKDDKIVITSMDGTIIKEYCPDCHGEGKVVLAVDAEQGRANGQMATAADGEILCEALQKAEK